MVSSSDGQANKECQQLVEERPGRLETMDRTAADVRRHLHHPVIDADGHFLEFMPLIDDDVLTELEMVGGPDLRDRYRHGALRLLDTVAFEADRRRSEVVSGWQAMPSWWGNPVADPRDRATAQLPGLMYERLDELGVDVMLTYPSWTLGFLASSDDELRPPACRAVNRHTAALFGPYRDRLRPAAIIPMHSPEEAVAELEHAVGELDFTLVLLAGYTQRSLRNGAASRLDVFGLDSGADYDPVWAACDRLKVAPVFHSSLQSVHPARSVSNYVFNHVGGIAAAHEALCKALFLGGVYRRFAGLRFGYLEGGVMWGASLLADLVGHWTKRGAHAIADLDPSQLDVGAVVALVEKYGTPDVVDNTARIAQWLARRPSRPAELDEFAAAAVTSAEEILTTLVERSFFGCEADDPLMPLAFGLRIGGERVELRPMLGTDVSHWDAPVMNMVLPEAYEAVDDGRLGRDEFEAFVFGNAVRLHGAMNPSFFVDTPCEDQAADVLEG
jgi:predicted TIM-barrel fold metal-dependent hydrolase